jgi:hypothetical protein
MSQTTETPVGPISRTRPRSRVFGRHGVERQPTVGRSLLRQQALRHHVRQRERAFDDAVGIGPRKRARRVCDSVFLPRRIVVELHSHVLARFVVGEEVGDPRFQSRVLALIAGSQAAEETAEGRSNAPRLLNFGP